MANVLNPALGFVVQKESQARTLLLVSGFVHDVTEFVDKHPGGAALVPGNSGKDMTAAFFGGIYEHSNAAHNVRFPHDTSAAFVSLFLIAASRLLFIFVASLHDESGSARRRRGNSG